MSGRYVIYATKLGFAIELDGIVVAIGTGSEACARTLLGQPDFREEVEEWRRSLYATMVA